MDDLMEKISRYDKSLIRKVGVMNHLHTYTTDGFISYASEKRV